MSDYQENKNMITVSTSKFNSNNFFEQQRRIQKQFKRLLPDITSYEKIINKNAEACNRIVKSYADFMKPITDLNKKIAFPVNTRIKELSDLLSLNIPKYDDIFIISSSISEIYKGSNFVIPNYLSSYDTINQNILDTTKLFSNELSLLIDEDLSNYEGYSELLVSSSVSSSVHFQNLKNLNFYEVEIPEDPKKELNEVVKIFSLTTEAKIKEINEDWLIPLNGAKYSLCSKNPDKIRHAITSLRELLTQILHTLAPDKEIKKIYLEPQYYYNGNPTRKTRLHYILQNKYKNSCFLELIDKDINAGLALFDLYNKLTHKIIPFMNDEDLLLLVKRTEILIESLI
ncbi:hypothetical protein CSA08_04840 [Candidatus Gracilibacteria bacterium]|nr:MAG: hypothetical protein CSA08_04840 [Candidatus Gracilibacteria bacterium]